MQPVECAACGNQVLCEKFSPAHTSVQWTAEAAAVCPEFGALVAAGETAARIRTCAALRDSIDRATAEGTLRVTTLEAADV
ncbi:hypothetical protein [Streptomyces purpurogeneiscleroticus]|uniref:hypothetical protein n=1 Tax=Streptomyces purpurogeneiscleroticus TaxID=68259 RepID=UPI001CBF644E|nr:hypothetical protein [Streptomyces purpurogeneiscleroticus]MBZ4018402.1 hypothetical protein [Streptomyces purpurogeneiscleroticus]